MYLGPHQFQVQGRYFEDSIHFATTSLWFGSFGLTSILLDADALRNGTVAVVHARGLMPDGMPLHMPDCDAVPPPRAMGDSFPPTADGMTVLLGIPARKPQGGNCALTPSPAESAARFVAENRTFPDENSGADELPVRIGRKNLRLVLDTEPWDGLVVVPIARVKRDGSGHYMFDPDFVPPCVQISASEKLMLMSRRLIEILEAKSTALSRSTGTRVSSAEFASREIATFWLLHAVNSALAPLRHIWISKRGHPEELFLELSRLAGALCTFARDAHPNSLPVYDHMRLGECFDALDRHIRLHLEVLVPTNCVTIQLRKIADYFYEGDIEDTRCLGRARWVFGIRSKMGEADLIMKPPILVKLCSAKFVGELVRRAIAGLTLTHLPMPPTAIQTKLEMQYFGVSREGPFWDHINQTKKVGIYVPGDFPEAELELLVVLEN
jgi:type VI secretion system protein ImpJ